MIHQNLALPTVRLILGICAIVLSLIFSIQFVSNGASGAAIISAIVFCVITEFAKVAFTGDCAYYWEIQQGSKALFSAVIVTVLFVLSISAAVFVLTIAPAKEQTIVASSESQQAQLEDAIKAKKEQLAECNQNYLSKCVNPRTAELTQLENELHKINGQNTSLLEAKASQQFWDNVADYLGTDANSLQLNFAIARAVLLDLLGLILISQYTATRRINSDFVHKNDSSAAEVFALMSAKIEALEKQTLEKKQ